MCDINVFIDSFRFKKYLLLKEMNKRLLLLKIVTLSVWPILSETFDDLDVFNPFLTPYVKRKRTLNWEKDVYRDLDKLNLAMVV